MDFIERYEWLFFLGLLAAAVSTLWARDVIRSKGNAAERTRASRRALTFLFWAGLPWFVAAVGIMFGGMDDVDGFFDLRNRFWSPLFLASIVAVYVALLYWLHFRGGAEEIAASGQMRFFGPIRDPESVKLVFLAMVLGGVVGVAAWVITKTS